MELSITISRFSIEIEIVSLGNKSCWDIRATSVNATVLIQIYIYILVEVEFRHNFKNVISINQKYI